MAFLKYSLLISTSLLFGSQSSWAMESFGKDSEKHPVIKVKKGKNLENLHKNNVKDKTILVTITLTKLLNEQEDKKFSQKLQYHWKVRNYQPIKDPSARLYAEEMPFIDLVQLLNSSSNSPQKKQNLGQLINQDKQTILDLYFQGTLDLTWSQHGFNFNQYCTHKDEPFHTLAVTSKEGDVIYYKQQRYTDSSRSGICDIYCDSRFQVEYWKDREGWVVDHPDEGEVNHTTRRQALKTLKSAGELSVEERLIGMEDGILSFFLHPSVRWLKEKVDREDNESPSYLKAGAMAWLLLSGDFLNNYLNVPLFKVKNTNEEKEIGFNENKIPNLRMSTNDESSFMSILSNFSPYSLIAPILVSLLASKDGKFNYLQFVSTASTLFPGVWGGTGGGSIGAAMGSGHGVTTGGGITKLVVCSEGACSQTNHASPESESLATQDNTLDRSQKWPLGSIPETLDYIFSSKSKTYIYSLPEKWKQNLQISVRAADILHKRAEQGDTQAQKTLSEMYKNGYGVKKDLEECKKWDSKANNQGTERTNRMVLFPTTGGGSIGLMGETTGGGSIGVVSGSIVLFSVGVLIRLIFYCL